MSCCMTSATANCRWATSAEQARNTRRNIWVTIGDKTMCINDWAKIAGIKGQTLKARLKVMTPEEAITAPRSNRGSKEAGERQLKQIVDFLATQASWLSTPDVSRLSGVNYGFVKVYLRERPDLFESRPAGKRLLWHEWRLKPS